MAIVPPTRSATGVQTRLMAFPPVLRARTMSGASWLASSRVWEHARPKRNRPLDFGTGVAHLCAASYRSRRPGRWLSQCDRPASKRGSAALQGAVASQRSVLVLAPADDGRYLLTAWLLSPNRSAKRRTLRRNSGSTGAGLASGPARCHNRREWSVIEGELRMSCDATM